MKMYGMNIYTKGLTDVNLYRDSLTDKGLILSYEDGRNLVMEVESDEKRISLFKYLILQTKE